MVRWYADSGIESTGIKKERKRKSAVGVLKKIAKESLLFCPVFLLRIKRYKSI